MNNNKFTISFSAISENESFARSVISCFMLKLNPSIAELSDVKTAVSEAVTNCIVHGYPNGTGEIIMSAEICGRSLHINILHQNPNTTFDALIKEQGFEVKSAEKDPEQLDEETNNLFTEFDI